MSVFDSPELSDVVNEAYVTGTVTVGTTQVEAKVGGSPLAGREILVIHNSSNSTIYYGPTGVTTSTGAPLFKDQVASVPIGVNLSVFLIAGSAGNVVRVQELA